MLPPVTSSVIVAIEGGAGGVVSTVTAKFGAEAALTMLGRRFSLALIAYVVPLMSVPVGTFAVDSEISLA